MRIFLIGYMGSGKSTIGRKLSTKLNLELIDLDDYIETEYKISIPSLFEKYDEPTFRKIESDMLAKVCKMDNVVISTGGGSPCYNQNIDLILKSGLCIYVKMSVNSLFNRLINAKRIRPLISKFKGDELMDFITVQLEQRSVYYEQAHLVLKGEDFDLKTAIQKIQLHPFFK